MKALLLPQPRIRSALQKLFHAWIPASLGQVQDACLGARKGIGVGLLHIAKRESPQPLSPFLFCFSSQMKKSLSSGSCCFAVGCSQGHDQVVHGPAATQRSLWWWCLQKQQSNTSRCPLCPSLVGGHTLACVSVKAAWQSVSPLEVWATTAPALCPRACC